MTWNIYVIGNIKSFFGVFTMLQMLFDPSNNTAWASSSSAWGGPLIGLMLIISLIIIVIASFLQGRFLIHHIMIMAIAYAVMLGVTTNVNIENVYNGQSQLVSGIPIGVAVPASIFSTAFWAITKEMGQADDSVTTDDTNMFSGSSSSNQVYGFDGPLALMYNLRGLYSTFSDANPALSRSIKDYVDFCVAPDTSVLYSMGSQKNLATALFSTTPPEPNVMDTLYVNSSGDPVSHYSESCSSAESTLSGAWSVFETGSMPSGSKNLGETIDSQLDNGSVSSLDASQAATLLDNVFMTTGNDGYRFMNNMILNCEVQAGANANQLWDSSQSGPMSSYCSTKATAFGRSVTLNAANASLFEMNMIPMMAILQFLFFAGFPIIIVVAMAMGPNGFGKIGAFMAFGATTLAWIPIAQLISNYAQSNMHDTMAQLQNTLNGGAMTASNNIPILLEHAMRSQAMADKMLALTPVVTMVLLGLGGAYAATRLAQDQSEESSASQAVGETTPMEGNNTLTQGTSGVQFNSTGVASRGRGTSEMAGMSPAYAGASFNMASTMGSAIAAAQQQEAAYTQSASASSANAWKTGFQYANSSSTGVQSYLKHNTNADHGLSQMKQESAELGKTWGMTAEQAVAVSAAMKGQFGADFMGLGASAFAGEKGAAGIASAIKSANVGLSGDAGEVAKIQHALSQQSNRKLASSVTSSKNAKLLHSIATGSETTAGRTAAASMTHDAALSGQDTRNATAARKQADSLSRMVNASNSMTGNEAVNMATMEGMMANYDKNKPKSAADAVMKSRQFADQNGLGGIWEHYNNAASKNMNPAAAAAFANIMTANDATSMGKYQAAGNFWEDTMNGLGSYGTQAKTGAAVHKGMKTGAKMPGKGAELQNQVAAATPPDSATGNAAQSAANQGAAQARYNGTNPNAEYNPSAPDTSYADSVAKGFGLNVAAFNKKLAQAKAGQDGNALMEVAKAIEDNPAAAMGIAAGVGAAATAATALGGRALVKRMQNAKAAEDGTDGPDGPKDVKGNSLKDTAKPVGRDPMTPSDTHARLTGGYKAPASDGAGESPGETMANDENMIKNMMEGHGNAALKDLEKNLNADQKRLSDPDKMADGMADGEELPPVE